MENEINGELVTLSGRGDVSSRGLRLDIDISRIPADWNPIIVPCICSGPGPDPIDRIHRIPGLMSISDRGYRTTPGTSRVATLFDDGGQIVAAVRATGTYEKTESEYSFSISVQTRTRKDSILPILTSIDHYSFSIAPHGPSQVEVIAHYSLSADNGSRCFGWTHIYYDLLGQPRSLAAPLIGSNNIEVAVSGNRMSYSTYQRAHSALDLGQFW